MKKIILLTSLLVFITMFSTNQVTPLIAEEDIPVYSLEKALTKYMLSYEAYRKARTAKKEIRANVPKFMKMYREAYAQYQELMQDADVYDPQHKYNNPAGLYNDKEKAKGEYPILWKEYVAEKERKEVRESVKKGMSPSEVNNIVNNNLPKQPRASRYSPPEPEHDEPSDNDTSHDEPSTEDHQPSETQPSEQQPQEGQQ